MSAAVRPARVEDSGCIARIDAQVSFSPWSEERFAALCAQDDRARGRILVLEQDGQVQAFALFAQVLDQASIYNIAVHPARQGRGLGRLLLTATLRAMASCGASCCLLEVRESNRAARGLYSRCGFKLDGVRKGYYPTRRGREDALLMSCELSESVT